MMGQRVSRTSFDWSYTEEPHATRRKVILRKHPEVKDLFGLDHSFKWVVSAMVVTQIIACYLLKDADWLLIILQAYFYGGVVNHALTLAIHEISHNLAYGNHRPLANRIFGMWSNLPIGLPVSVSFKKYHIEHHRYLGEEVLDTDVPTELEGALFNTTFRKVIWLLLQPLFYGLRPLITYRKQLTDLEILNFVVQMVFNVLVCYCFGFKALFFLLFGTVVSMGIHPTAGHFISEHYVFSPGYETYSYYGPLNLVTFNVGYHVEHHDFPFVPGDKLPQLKALLPEHYDHLPHHLSWIWVLWAFATDPKLGPYARVKRKPRVEQEYFGVNMLDEYVEGFLFYVGYYQVKGWLKSLYSKFVVGASCMEEEASHLKQG